MRIGHGLTLVSPASLNPGMEASVALRICVCKTVPADAALHLCAARGCCMCAHACSRVSVHTGLGANWVDLCFLGDDPPVCPHTSVLVGLWEQLSSMSVSAVCPDQ